MTTRGRPGTGTQDPAHKGAAGLRGSQGSPRKGLKEINQPAPGRQSLRGPSSLGPPTPEGEEGVQGRHSLSWESRVGSELGAGAAPRERARRVGGQVPADVGRGEGSGAAGGGARSARPAGVGGCWSGARARRWRLKPCAPVPSSGLNVHVPPVPRVPRVPRPPRPPCPRRLCSHAASHTGSCRAPAAVDAGVGWGSRVLQSAQVPGCVRRTQCTGTEVRSVWGRSEKFPSAVAVSYFRHRAPLRGGPCEVSPCYAWGVGCHWAAGDTGQG